MDLIKKKSKEKEMLELTKKLKEEELKEIEIMIECLEKERQTIANNLHNDLSSLMVNLKFHYNDLLNKRSLELYNKTQDIIDELIQKVRTVSNAKYSEIIARQGLFIALQNMVAKISNYNKTTINVIDYGLKSRLKPSLGLSIFNILREHIINTIKYTNASLVNIHMIYNKSNLNIIVEDNDKECKIRENSSFSRIGILIKRNEIENLGGSLVIDPEINKGTTVIIDIPLSCN